MNITPKQYAEALMQSLEGTDPKEIDLVLNNFVEILAANGDVKKFQQIEEEFNKLDLAGKGIKIAEVASAHPLSKESERNIISELNKIVKGDVQIKKKIDENILGGVVIRVDDQMIDASVKNQLEELKEELSE